MSDAQRLQWIEGLLENRHLPIQGDFPLAFLDYTMRHLSSVAGHFEGWMPYAILMISLFIDESITLSPCPLISPSLRLNRMANFFMDDTLGLFIF
jgi:hypothetical protein